jgi:formyl-CoA transferase
VLKIEPPQGDETRGWGPPFDAHGTGSHVLGLNRNKRGMTMDLTQPAQREALLALPQDADVLVENFKTGTMEKWGLGFDTLHTKQSSCASCTAASAASAPTAPRAACPATTPPSRPWWA